MRASPAPSSTPDPVHTALAVLAEGGRLSEAEVDAAFGVLMRGDASPERAAALLMGMRVQGESGIELAGAARALRAVMRRITLPSGAPVVDTAGTGGGRATTFNISTAAAFVAAAAGARVAKHGNRSYSSRSGSADVLEALGIDLAAQADHAERILRDVGMVFLFAPAFHPAMRFVGPVRRELAVPTVMNLVGPLVNPGSVRRQVVGVADRVRAPVIADALRRLETEHALVVHAEVGMDEVSPVGLTHVWEVRAGAVTTWTLDPRALGVAWDDLGALRGGEPAENARRVADLFRGPAADPAGAAATVLNAAAALYVAGIVATLEDGVTRARNALERGEALRVLEALRAASPSSGE